MIREILFRGKGLDNDKWIYGDLIHRYNYNRDMEYEYSCLSIKPLGEPEQFVDENTIGQFTGLWDDNGKKVYEGDILKFNNGNIGHVKFENAMFVVENYYCSYQDDPTNAFSERAKFYVIGNIHDNPELLKYE